MVVPLNPSSFKGREEHFITELCKFVKSFEHKKNFKYTSLHSRRKKRKKWKKRRKLRKIYKMAYDVKEGKESPGHGFVIRTMIEEGDKSGRPFCGWDSKVMEERSKLYIESVEKKKKWRRHRRRRGKDKSYNKRLLKRRLGRKNTPQPVVSLKSYVKIDGTVQLGIRVVGLESSKSLYKRLRNIGPKDDTVSENSVEIEEKVEKCVQEDSHGGLLKPI